MQHERDRQQNNVEIVIVLDGPLHLFYLSQQDAQP